ncbi:MAG: hypothetical protein A4E72_00329 [Syntrophus sp. PtaU1.Bin208]|nr:MAG: hypothetical protein A4E72_00329 [Syntrophus sp. PtaU1.Bin208]
MQRNRFGRHAARREDVEGVEGLRFKAVCLEGAFQPLPYPRFHDGVQKVDDEKSAIGLQQGACVNAAEIRRPDARAVDHPFDGAEEVFKVGVIFHDDGLGFRVAVVHEEIYRIRQERIALADGKGHPGHHRLLWSHAEGVQIVCHILDHFIQISVHLFIVILFLQFVRRICDALQEDVAVHLFQLFLDFPLHIPDFHEDAVHLLRQLMVLVFHGVILFLRILPPFDNAFQFFHGGWLIVDDGHDHRARHLPYLNLDDGKALLLDAGIQILEELFALFLILFEDFFLHREVVFALEEHGDVFLEIFYKGVDVVPELPSHFCRETKQSRRFRILEVIHIAEVVGNDLLPGHFLKNFKNRGHSARTGGARYKDIVALLPDAQTETEGLQGPVLADNLLQWVKFTCRFKGKCLGIQLPAKFFRWYG